MNEDEASEWAINNYGTWSDKYNSLFGFTPFYDQLREYMICSESADPLRFYCGHSARHLNNYLRNIRKPFKDMNNFNDALVMLLLFSPRIPDNIRVYRYVPDDVIKALLKENKENKCYVDKGFSSCSLLKNPPNKADFDYHDNILEIYVDKGTLGVYTSLIDYNNKGEYELLILRNSKMYLIDYPIRDYMTKKNIYKVRLQNIIDGEIDV